MAEVLEQARRMRYDVGSNLKGGGPAALWTLAMPSLDTDAAVILGTVHPEERSALGRFFRTTVIAGDRRGPAENHVERALRGRRLDAIRIGSGNRRQLHADEAVAKRLASHEDWAPLVYRECAAAHDREEATLSLRPGLDEPTLLARMAPGEPRVLAPADDPAVRDWLARSGWLEPRERLALHRPVEAIRIILRRARRSLPDHAHLEGSEPGALRRAPRYVLELAAGEGLDLTDARWALVAPGSYATQKVLLFLFRQQAVEPDTIVKLAPDPAHAGRLMTEADALRRLGALDLTRGRIPALRFGGVHAGRAVVGEEWLSGRPFREVARASADCPHLDAAAESLTTLAIATRQWRPAAEIGAALRDLLGRFIATYAVDEVERRFLDEQVERVAGHAGDLPVVAQHGDPGAWNLMVDDEQRTVLLDWESSEAAGVPVWDLAYFLRSYGSLASRREGIRGRLEVGSRHLLGDSALQARFSAEIARHARSVQLPAPMIEPLFYACWMHRALKEATRRTQPHLESGHYRRLLTLLIRNRSAPSVRRLVSGTGS